MSDFTNFNGYSHGQLRSMVHAMDSGGVMSAGDPWRKAADTLKQIRTTLNSASGDATSSWEGSSSEAFYSKMTKLASSVNNVAAYANDAAITMKMMSEAIDQAKHDMPEEPSFLDKVGDAVGDTAKSAVGIDDQNTRTTITDERKAKAVAVMNILATRYRAAASYLKPPPFGAGYVDDVTDIPPPADPTGAAAIGALIMGGGLGLASIAGSSEAVGTSSRSSGSTVDRTPQSPKLASAGPVDPGIRGGMANPAPNPQPPGNVGPGTGGGGVVVGPRPGSGGGSGLSLSSTGAGSGGHGAGGGTGISGGGSEPVGGSIGGNVGGVGGRFGGSSGATERSSARGGGAFGSGGVEGAEGGAGGRGGSLGRRSGGVVGEAGSGAVGRRGFTEGGSGLGRGRGLAGKAAGQAQGHGAPGGAQANKKDKKQAKDRPDYLVEDEETWASGDKPNPNVVE